MATPTTRSGSARSRWAGSSCSAPSSGSGVSTTTTTSSTWGLGRERDHRHPRGREVQRTARQPDTVHRPVGLPLGGGSRRDATVRYGRRYEGLLLTARRTPGEDEEVGSPGVRASLDDLRRWGGGAGARAAIRGHLLTPPLPLREQRTPTRPPIARNPLLLSFNPRDRRGVDCRITTENASGDRERAASNEEVIRMSGPGNLRVLVSRLHELSGFNRPHGRYFSPEITSKNQPFQKR